MPPYRDAKTRVSSYELSVIPDNVRAKFDARKSSMVDGQEVQQGMIVDMETKVRDLLDNYGIIGVFRVPYLNFARSLFRSKGHQGGVALKKIANAEKAKALEYGLDAAILDAIISIVIPAVPY